METKDLKGLEMSHCRGVMRWYTDSKWVYPLLHPCLRMYKKKPLKVQIDGIGNGLSSRSRRSSYHSYSININCTVKLWQAVLVVAGSKHLNDWWDGGLGLSWALQQKGFLWLHIREINTLTKACSSPKCRYIIQWPKIIIICSFSLSLPLSASFCFSLFLSMRSAMCLRVFTGSE